MPHVPLLCSSSEGNESATTPIFTDILKINQSDLSIPDVCSNTLLLDTPSMRGLSADMAASCSRFILRIVSSDDMEQAAATTEKKAANIMVLLHLKLATLNQNLVFVLWVFHQPDAQKRCPLLFVPIFLPEVCAPRRQQHAQLVFLDQRLP